MASSRSVVDSAARIVSCGSIWPGYSTASSSCVRNPAMGLLSSWEVSEANCRCCSTAPSRRARVWLAVRASNTISSSPGGSGTRRLRSEPVSSDIRVRIAATGCSVRPTMDQVIHAARAMINAAPPAMPYSSPWVARIGGSAIPA
nr:hypothetical protein [Actinomadura sp. HBU206391]